MIEEAFLEAEEKMDKAIEVAKEDLGAIRTGRAAPSMFSKISVDYYGAPTPLPQLASVSIPDTRMAVCKPYAVSLLAPRTKACRDPALGVNPTTDGPSLRVVCHLFVQEASRGHR